MFAVRGPWFCCCSLEPSEIDLTTGKALCVYEQDLQDNANGQTKLELIVYTPCKKRFCIWEQALHHAHDDLCMFSLDSEQYR